MIAAALRIASVPSGHVYVRHLSHPEGVDNVRRLADPVPPGAPVGQWWPPPMLEAEWVRRYADTFDLFHVHFGFDDRSPEQLRDLLAALRAVNRPLIVTIHDLRNPHQLDPRPHDAALNVLIPGADQLITLTHPAAGEIARRWQRRAVVIPHPHVVDFHRMGQPRPAHPGMIFGLHAKSERINNQSVVVARALQRIVSCIPDVALRVDVHNDARGVQVAAALHGLDVRVHQRFSDEQLWDYLSEIDVSVLPYRFGTHSGWFEACRDLGTTVLAPDCGYYAAQGPCLVFRHGVSGLDEQSLSEAVRAVVRERPKYGAGIFWREQQRRQVAMSHRRVYEIALGRRHPGLPVT